MEDDFPKKYPHLAREIREKITMLPLKLDASSEAENETEDTLKDPLYGFQPGLIDFIRRSTTPEEALSVIDFLEQQKEISEETAEATRLQLKEKGLESFGPHKGWGHYEKERRKRIQKL